MKAQVATAQTGTKTKTKRRKIITNVTRALVETRIRELLKTLTFTLSQANSNRWRLGDHQLHAALRYQAKRLATKQGRVVTILDDEGHVVLQINPDSRLK